jgi:hypothetical protein
LWWCISYSESHSKYSHSGIYKSKDFLGIQHHDHLQQALGDSAKNRKCTIPSHSHTPA